MTDVSQPRIPWWVRWWTDPTTTRSGLRQQACLFFVLAALFLCISAVDVFWRPSWWTGRIVLPVAAGLFPVAFTVAGVWILVASGWIDRHDAWNRIASEQERQASQDNNSSPMSWGLLLLALGGVAGGVVGWVWETEVGMVVGVAFGAAIGFVFGSFLAGVREGLRSKNPGDKSRYAVFVGVCLFAPSAAAQPPSALKADDKASQAKLVAAFTSHTSEVMTLAFTADGQRDGNPVVGVRQR